LHRDVASWSFDALNNGISIGFEHGCQSAASICVRPWCDGQCVSGSHLAGCF
jgi:hypothetical protein